MSRTGASALFCTASRSTLRLAAASPDLTLCDPEANAEEIIKCIIRSDELDVSYLALPELCITGATAGSLLSHDILLNAASRALQRILKATQNTSVTTALGLPYRMNGKVRSCSALICAGRVYAIIPSGTGDAPFGFLPELDYDPVSKPPLTPIPRLLLRFGNELFDQAPKAHPGCVILSPGALNATATSFEQLTQSLSSYSARTGCAIAYASPNPGESGSFYLFDGVCAVAAHGSILAVSEPFSKDPFVYADVNMAELSQFEPYVSPDEIKGDTYLSCVPEIQKKQCRRILDLQAAALSRRLIHMKGKGFVIGVSGGLDSTMALLACAAAADDMGLKRDAVLGVSMPGFGTSERTKSNAKRLVEALSCKYMEISVKGACERHFEDIGHDIKDKSIVFENAQARERTKILLSLSNKYQLLDVGTGDLSESALGWTTFCGDHMSQYAINSSLPKTVIRLVVREAAERFREAADILENILDTPVSPELLPPDKGGITQKTEQILGYYELHDFFLYQLLANKAGPAEIYRKAKAALPYDEDEIYRVLGIFLNRFFSSQFKRNSGTEGPNILLSVSPFAFVMPSDLIGSPWMKEYLSIKNC
ncbi:MAG: Glutamine-dependent NAD(+) synthetase [Firmicutes bacterium ADurb.Bin182]|nr:MAG: Glutamine-dependent NAD(+) synthetase [Firmicutes bacterium ADurb.Bin182]